MDDDDFDQRPAAISLAALLVLVFEKAWHLSRHAARRIEPLVTPPPELRVTARGTLYSGVIILDRNEVIFGVVVASGYDPSSGTAPPFTAPSLSSTTSTALDRLRREQAETNDPFGDRRGRLPGWAETGDDDYGAGSWRR